MEFTQVKDYILDMYKNEELPYVYEKLESGEVVKIALTRAALSVDVVNPDALVKKLEDAQKEKEIVEKIHPDIFKKKEEPVVEEVKEEAPVEGEVIA